jgi:hypothetical protein
LWGFGGSCIKSLTKNMSQTDIFTYVLDLDSQLEPTGDYELYPIADKIVKEWINKNFPNWNDYEIEKFINGICYSGFFI